MKKYIKSLAIIIAFSIMFSSCSVYYKKEATFNEAYLSKKPVRFITHQNKKVFVKEIIWKDSMYYGVYKLDGKKITFPLSKENYRSVRIKNQAASTVLNVCGTVVGLGIIVIGVAAASINDLNFGAPKNPNPTYKN